MSICPKNKSSKGRRDKRRANWKMTAPALVKCSKCGELMMPHRVSYIRSIGTMDMCLHNGTNIPLAQRRVADIKKHYLAFQMEE